jgi:hypothetical protein
MMAIRRWSEWSSGLRAGLGDVNPVSLPVRVKLRPFLRWVHSVLFQVNDTIS